MKPRRPALSGDWAERKRRARVVSEHRATYGNWCPGWGRPPHPATNLAADHIVEVAIGGDEYGPLAVLCTGCNGRKSNANRAAARRNPLRTSRQW